jgi:hypothetical protein
VQIVQIHIENRSRIVQLEKISEKMFSVSYDGPELNNPYLIVNSLSWTMNRFAVCLVTNKNDSSSSVWLNATVNNARRSTVVLVNIFVDLLKHE